MLCSGCTALHEVNPNNNKKLIFIHLANSAPFHTTRFASNGLLADPS